MSTIRTSSVRRTAYDHFEPQTDDDPHAQRRVRARLEQIDYAAFAANKELIGALIGDLSPERLQRLAVATAHARARWAAEALAAADQGPGVAAERVRAIAEARVAFEELAEAYDAVRRMVERGYVG